MRRHLGPQPAQVENSIDPPQQMIGRNHVLQVELVEKTILPANRRSHHRRISSALASKIGNHDQPARSYDFFDSLSQKKTFHRLLVGAAQRGLRGPGRILPVSLAQPAHIALDALLDPHHTGTT